MPQALAAVVAAEDQESRRVVEPGLSERAVRQQGNDLLPQLRIVHDHDVALLKIAFRRRAQSQCAQPAERIKRHRLGRKRSYRAARRQLTMKKWRARCEIEMRAVRSKSTVECPISIVMRCRVAVALIGLQLANSINRYAAAKISKEVSGWPHDASQRLEFSILPHRGMLLNGILPFRSSTTYARSTGLEQRSLRNVILHCWGDGAEGSCYCVG